MKKAKGKKENLNKQKKKIQYLMIREKASFSTSQNKEVKGQSI